MGKIIFFGGKGGVGKTSCSTAYAIGLSQKGLKTLLVSTDPAHSISDLFSEPIGSEVKLLSENLYGIEINPEEESRLYINKVRMDLKKIMSPIIMEDLNKQLDAAIVSPGSHESALFDKMVTLIIDENESFDRIVFDTAPTGHTVRLLSLPELLGGWIESLMSKRKKTISLKNMIGRNREEEDPILTILSRRKENLEKARRIMMDEDQLEFAFVLNAERMPIQETKKAVELLRHYKIKVSTLVVNKILPEAAEDEFWRHKKLKEREYLKEIKEGIQADHIFEIPLFQEDMTENTICHMANFFSEKL
ncbi:MAG: ArsA family ATPase [Clostridia bacterium]|nr:ArsA family ATPase [Clostridia bacterium]